MFVHQRHGYRQMGCCFPKIRAQLCINMLEPGKTIEATSLSLNSDAEDSIRVPDARQDVFGQLEYKMAFCFHYTLA